MIELMLIEVFIKAAILCGILYLVARHEADYSFAKAAMVVAGLFLGSVLIKALVEEHLGHWSLLIEVAFASILIMTFCWTTPAKSLLVVTLYAAAHFGLTFGFQAVFRKLLASSEDVPTATEKHYQEVQEVHDGVVQMLNDAYGGAPEPRAERPPGPPAPESPSPAEAEDPPPATDGVDWDSAREHLDTSAVMVGPDGKEIAVVNGQVVERFDILSTRFEDRLYRWRVKAIQDGTIDLEPINVIPPK